MIYKRIVILANSRKHSGRCLAGREIVGQHEAPRWIRPVSDRQTAEVSEYESKYADSSYPQVLEIVDVPLISAKPFACHTENWLLSPDDYWIKRGEVDWDYALTLAEQPEVLWNSGDSTFAGNNDQIEIGAAEGLTNSITLISVPALEIHVLTPGASFGNPKKRVQARFTYRNIPYWLWVTDPIIENQYLASSTPSAQAHQLGHCLISVSLAEITEKPRTGTFYHYKLVAAIIKKPSA